MAPESIQHPPGAITEGVQTMGYPDWGGPGAPVIPGDPFSEGVNQYGASGLYYSRGGARIQYENPDFPSWYRTESGAYRATEPVRVSGTAPGVPELGRWVAPAEPREPYVPVLDVAPTPVPSNDLVPVEHPTPRNPPGPRGERKQAPKKSLPSSPGQQGRGSFWLFKGGYYGRA